MGNVDREGLAPRLLRTTGVAVGLLAAGMLLTIVLDGGARAQQGSDGTDQDLVARGAEVFGARCATCHGEEGRGISRQTNPSQFGPNVQGAGPAAFDFMIRTGRMPLDSPTARLRHRPQILTDQEREAVVAWSRTLPGGGPDIPDVDGWESADLSHGLAQFTTNCAACHGPTAAGIAVGQRDFSSPLDEATPLEIAEAVRTGPGVMPVFGDEVIPPDELESIVRWVIALRDRDTPAGVTVGRSGPVSEGLVAWVLGMGLIAVVMYVLGQKAGDDEEPDDADA